MQVSHAEDGIDLHQPEPKDRGDERTQHLPGVGEHEAVRRDYCTEDVADEQQHCASDELNDGHARVNLRLAQVIDFPAEHLDVGTTQVGPLTARIQCSLMYLMCLHFQHVQRNLFLFSKTQNSETGNTNPDRLSLQPLDWGLLILNSGP